MITRIEIDGFKSFADFGLDLPPFLAIIGTNASGKSNLLDALTFLSTAVPMGVRGAAREVRGDPRGLFRQRADGTRVDRMRFAVEVLGLSDEGFKEETRWRYELEIAWAPGRHRIEGLRVDRERIFALHAESDRWPGRVGVSPDWAKRYLRYGKTTWEHVRSSETDGDRDDLLFADGMSVGDDAVTGRAIVANELSSLRVFRFDVGELRQASELDGSAELGEDGSNIPNFISQLQEISSTDNRPRGVVADIEAQLVALVRDITGFDVIVDERRRDARIEFTSQYMESYGCSFASDGTLRMLGILAVANDPSDDQRSIAIEEPENGVFPERLRHLLGLLEELVADPSEAQDDRLKQIIVTSHSPVVLDAVRRDHIVFLDSTTRLEGGVASRVTRARWLQQPGESANVSGERYPRVTESEITRFIGGLQVAGKKD